MSRIRGKNTRAEFLLRKAILSTGIRGYRLHYKLLGKPDIVFPKNKIAIFIDGCFWHKCPKCFIKPTTNREFWREKISSNVKRDKFVNSELRKRGWKVLRIWEHEVKNEKIIKQKIIDEIKNENPKIKVLDLFAGAGGFSLGFDLVKDKEGNKAYEIVLAVDDDKHACQTLKSYFNNECENRDVVLEGDLTSDNTHNKIIDRCKGGIDVVIGGPPCQSFSLIGPRSGYKNEDLEKYKIMDKLYVEYLKLVEELKPTFVIFENVKGILSKKGGCGKHYIDIIISDFKKLGYSFESENENIKTDYIIFNTADYGVPQTRKRVFLIGNNLGIKNPYPVATHDESEHVTMFEAIGDLPKLKAKITYTGIKKKEREDIDRYNKKIYNGEDEIKYHVDSFKKHYKSVGEKSKAFLDFINSNGNSELTHHVARRQKRDDVLLFKGMRQGMIAKDVFESKNKNIRELGELIKYDMSSFTDKYKKQRWSKPCSTIFAHLEKDGNRFIHPDSRQARTITPREAARIQSFPDWYEFEGPFTNKFRQIGNAVPPLMAHHIGIAVYKIGGIK